MEMRPIDNLCSMSKTGENCVAFPQKPQPIAMSRTADGVTVIAIAVAVDAATTAVFNKFIPLS